MNPHPASLGANAPGRSVTSEWTRCANEPPARRIALVCDWYFPRIGGIERHLVELAKRLLAAGHAVTVITPMPGATSRPEGTRLQPLPANLLPGANLIWTPAAFRRLGALLRDGDFDVVHAHTSIVSPAGFAALYHAQRAGIPAVATSHSILGRHASVFRALNRIFHWSRWPVVYSAVSERAAREIRRCVTAERVAVLPNAIDPAEWQVQRREPGDTVTFATVMRLVPRKRGDALLRAFRTAVERCPKGAVRLKIAGEGPERRRLHRLARSLGIAPAVEFLGAVSSAEVKQALAAADAFVLSSKLEAFGIAALEARAAGLPVIALRESGVAEFIAHGVDGLLASSDAELAANLVRLARDTALRQRIAEHNRCAPVACTWEAVLAKHLETYERAMVVAGRIKRSAEYHVMSTEGGVTNASGW